jgi:hypothetical protein
VSSTLGELAAERAAVARAISAVGLTPVMFELGARPHPPRELYRAYLAQSDIFIGLYWQRYGWIGPDMDVSGLEDEFRLSASMPRLLYLKTPAPDREARLTAMIAELQAKGTVSYRSFRSPRDLGRLVRDDLAVLLSERFAAGDSGAAHPASSTSSSGRRIPRSLPVASTSLIGREHDIADVARLLETPLRKETPGKPPPRWVPPTGCGDAPDCVRGHRRVEARPICSRACRGSSVPRSSRRSSRPDPSSIAVRRSLSCAASRRWTAQARAAAGEARRSPARASALTVT